MSQHIDKVGAISLIVLLVGVACLGDPTSSPTRVPTATATVSPTSTATATSTSTPTATATPTPTRTATPTVTPTATPVVGDSCLVGTWELSDLGGYLAAVMPPEISASDIKQTASEGSSRLTFDSDGQMSFQTKDYVVTLSARLQILPVSVDVSIEGGALGMVRLARNRNVILFDIAADDLAFRVTLGDIEIMSGRSNELVGLFGLDISGANVGVAYRCTRSTLEYMPPVEDARSIIFTRVEP